MTQIEGICYLLANILLWFGCGYLGCCIGCKKGFEKCKEIDDKTIDELVGKYKK